MRQTISIPCKDENGYIDDWQEVDLDSFKATITDVEMTIAKGLLQYAELQMKNPESGFYWDHFYMCHTEEEVVAEFIRPSRANTLEEVLASEDLILFHKIMGIKEESQAWCQ